MNSKAWPVFGTKGPGAATRARLFDFQSPSSAKDLVRPPARPDDVIALYSNTDNVVLWARSEKIGFAVFICRGMMEYWSDGIMKTRVWRNDIYFNLNCASIFS
jgi:hypothetical protein